MKIYKLKQFTRNWVIGNFYPSLYKSKIAVAVHNHKAGTIHETHMHKKATEINIVSSGICQFHFPEKKLKIIVKSGDILVIEPYEFVEFTAIKNTTITVIKTDSRPNDKYLYKPKKENNGKNNKTNKRTKRKA